jgi:autoinducer-2 kinase
MPSGFVMTIDLGTGSVRAIVFDEAGEQVAVASREWTHQPVPGVPASQSFDTARNWLLMVACIREVLSTGEISPESIAAVSTTSMREGIVLFDDADREIWACPNVDGRAGEQAAALVASGAAQRIYELSGDWVSITSPARLRWLHDHQPGLLGRASALGMLSDWATFRLCGRHVTEPSAGSSSGLFDLISRSWSAEILGYLDIATTILPEVVDPGTVVGVVTAACSTETGLAAGTPVVAAGADTQLALVGLGPSDQYTSTVIGGSFWQTTSLETNPVIDSEARLRTLCHTQADEWMIEGIGFYSGFAMRWLRDAFCETEVAAAQRMGRSPYALMEQAAAAVPAGSEGVLAILANVMDAKRWVQAPPSFLQFTMAGPTPTGRVHCIRALEEAAAYVTRRHIEIIDEVVGRPRRQLRFAGGAAQGTLWPQIVADVTGLPVAVPIVKESTALGAAAYAAVGAGWAVDVATAFPSAGAVERTFEPDAKTHERYAEHYQRWLAVYPRMLELVEDGLLEPGWWPPGTPPPRSFARR